MPADGDLHPIGSGHGFRSVTVDLRIRTGPAHGVHVDGDLHNTGSGPGFRSVTVHLSVSVQALRPWFGPAICPAMGSSTDIRMHGDGDLRHIGSVPAFAP